MKNATIEFLERVWRQKGRARLILRLPLNPHGLEFMAKMTFTEKRAPDQTWIAGPRQLRIDLVGELTGVTDWHDIAGTYGGEGNVGNIEQWQQEEPDGIAPLGPSVDVLMSGGTLKKPRRYFQHGCMSVMHIFPAEDDDIHSFDVRLNAIFPTEKQMQTARQMFDKINSGAVEMKAITRLLNSIPSLRGDGQLMWDEVGCMVPLNTRDPIASAQRMAREQMGMTEFGLCHVDEGAYDGTFEPEDGVYDEGRLVVLCPPSVYYDGRVRRRKVPREPEPEREE